MFLGSCLDHVSNVVLARAEAIEEWNETAIEKYGSLEAAPNLPSKSEKLAEEWKSYVALPSQEDIEQEILRRRKEVKHPSPSLPFLSKPIFWFT